MEISAIVGLFVLGFLIGRAYQKWSDGTMDIEEGAYRAGYDEGARDAERGVVNAYESFEV